MQLRDLYEARRNPGINSRDSRTMKDILTPYLDGHYYVSFTAIPKLGVNPKDKWTTPYGVSTYPLFVPAAQQYVQREQFPFASDRKYINILQCTGKELLLSSITLADVENLLTKFDDFGLREKAEYLMEELGNWWGTDNPRLFYNLTNFLAIHREYRSLITQMPIGKEFKSTVLGLEAEVPYSWNKVIRELGYQVVTDDVGEIIHKVEPFQSIFLDPRAVGFVARENNPKNTKLTKVIRTGHIEYLVQRYNYSPSRIFTDAMYNSLSGSLGRYFKVEANEDIIRKLGQLARSKDDIVDITTGIKSVYEFLIGSPKMNLLKIFAHEALTHDKIVWAAKQIAREFSEPDDYTGKIKDGEEYSEAAIAKVLGV